jgi:hypothetical protein
VHARTDAVAALQAAHDRDADPLVRKVAGWHVPGGPRYERTKPRPARTANRATTRGRVVAQFD